jgi:proline dehydrogenase
VCFSKLGLLLRLARQWIAGERAEDGVARVRQANSKGILGLLNLLGEHVESKEEVRATIQEYLRLIELVDREKVESQISIKPTQLGLNIDYDYCLSNYLQILEACSSYQTGRNKMLWIDMENSPYTQLTLDLYKTILLRFPNTGIAIQSYLRRSVADLNRIIPLGAKVRLVKGAYSEDRAIAFKSRKEVSDNYSNLLKLVFEKSSDQNFVAVATHDSALIEESKSLAKLYPKVNYEYEMLMGVRDKLKAQLVKEGNKVREYIPYGPKWLDYSIRRIKEKKSNILLLARSLFVQ